LAAAFGPAATPPTTTILLFPGMGLPPDVMLLTIMEEGDVRKPHAFRACWA